MLAELDVCKQKPDKNNMIDAEVLFELFGQKLHNFLAEDVDKQSDKTDMCKEIRELQNAQQ